MMNHSEEDKLEYLRRHKESSEKLEKVIKKLEEASDNHDDQKYAEAVDELSDVDEYYCQHERAWSSTCMSCEEIHILLIRENRLPGITYEEWKNSPYGLGWEAGYNKQPYECPFPEYSADAMEWQMAYESGEYMAEE